MALRIQSAFVGGEIDPALQERTTLDKYNFGLKTGRNAMIGKSGRIMSRFGRRLIAKTKNDNEEVVLYAFRTGYGMDVVSEWGPSYMRVYRVDSTYPTGLLLYEKTTAYVAADIPNLRFVPHKSFLYIFCTGLDTRKFFLDPAVSGSGFVNDATVFAIPDPPSFGSLVATGAPAGYAVQYAVTLVKNGEESFMYIAAAGNLPIASGQSNKVTVRVITGTTNDGVTEIRVYRRPTNAGAFGFIGSSDYLYTSGGNILADFDDVGQAADYTILPPLLLGNELYASVGGLSAPQNLKSPNGVFYQQRLIRNSVLDTEAIYASRIGYPNNYTRSFPYSDDSALKFKAGASGASGSAVILDMLVNNGLLVFTEVGIFLHRGALIPANLALEPKGEWIIDPNVRPVSVPGGAIFVDAATNTIRALVWSEEALSFPGDELSIFSNHIFTDRNVNAMAFHYGKTPVFVCTFDDGIMAMFTYERSQNMQAWTRGDSKYVAEDAESPTAIKIEQVTSSGRAEKTFFLVNKGGKRYIECTMPRYVSESEAESDPEIDKWETIAFMDSTVSWRSLINDDLTGNDELTLTPVTPGEWDGELTLDCGSSGLFTTLGRGAVGTIFRHFNPDDRTSVDLEVVSRTSDDEVVVMPSAEFPEDYATAARLYDTSDTITGLSHLNGEEVAVIVDGYVVGSPNNDVDDLPQCVVSGGSLTLPNSLRGAIVHVGRPITADVETLDVATVEQRPTLIESVNVNKLYVKVHKSRGLFVGNKFPANDKVTDMQTIDQIDVDYSEDNEVIANRYQAPVTKRVEVILPGDWRSNGRVCFRQVDPIHFEILSIAPDVTDLRR